MMTVEQSDAAAQVGAPQEAAAARPASRRGGARPTPERSPELAHVSLTALRAYREELTTEENRVSYWRRLVQARIDVLVSRPGIRADLGRLQDVLTDAHRGSRRQALVAVAPSEDVPPLPDLAGLWTADPDPSDEPARDALVARLSAAERELSAYRSALHRRIDRATADLIARYHENPTSCLVALPSR